MFIRIEKGSSIPISRQIAGQIRAQCLAGTLRAGDRVLSVRELARQLTVNQNTILRVYEKLTAEGYLDRRQGDGTYVAEKPPTWHLDSQRKTFQEELDQLIRQGRLLGLDDSQLHACLALALGQTPPLTSSSDEGTML